MAGESLTVGVEFEKAVERRGSGVHTLFLGWAHVSEILAKAGPREYVLSQVAENREGGAKGGYVRLFFSVESRDGTLTDEETCGMDHQDDLVIDHEAVAQLLPGYASDVG
jgi:hypothetical protein